MFNNPKLDETLPHIGEEIEVDGMERYNLEHITRLGFPITPKDRMFCFFKTVMEV